MSGFEGTIVVHLRPSARLRWTVGLLHVIALALVTGGYPGAIGKYLLLAALLVNAWICDRRCCRARATDIVTVVLAADDRWQLIAADGRSGAARLLRAVPISPLLTALTFECEDRSRRHVAMLGDNVDADAFRRLRVRLRRSADITAAPGQP